MSKDRFCSFCGKHHNFVNAMIEGPKTVNGRAYICNECVDLSQEIVKEYLKSKENDNI